MRRFLALVACAACGSSGGGGKPAGPDAGGPAVAVTPPPPARPELPPDTRSLRLIRTVAARLGPDEAAKRIAAFRARFGANARPTQSLGERELQ